MSAKLVLVSCTVALLVQSAFSACSAGLAAPCGLAGNGYGSYGAGLGSYGSSNGGCGCGGISSYGGYGSYGAGLGGCGGVATNGGGLPVNSASPIAPVGVSVQSQNAIEGTLCAGGSLPFLGTVGIEGVVPTAGAGAVSYGSGSGAVGITSEGPIATGTVGPDVYGPGVAGYGLGNAGYGLGGIGCGLGGIASGLGGIGSGLGGQGCGCGARYM